MSKKRPVGLVAIVIYKSFVASLMAVTAIALLFTLKNHQSLEQFSESYILESKLTLIDFVLDKVLKLSPKTLRLSGIAALFYAGITTIEAVGLWHEKAWAEVLVIILVGVSIPLEILELIRGISLLKLIVFLINIAVLLYLIYRFLNFKLKGRLSHKELS
ncbi:MAG: DUF2127 domain-containing protein [Thermosynechococcaceae cyanobacterium MS004]|nr:DUF2127 domain-containing protein [Thermosynechococcaceae cyanobacterium MS004]